MGDNRFLFTTLPSNDLGLLTRSLPIAKALSARGHRVHFSNPGKAPSRLIADARFENIKPKHPIYEFASAERTLRGVLRLARRERIRREYGGAFAFLFELLRSIPLRFARPESDTWDMDHMMAIAGLMSSNFVRANCEAFRRVMEQLSPDAVVDFWNPFACIAARALGIPLITVIQADAHPQSKGFIWWRPRPTRIPSAVPSVNKVRGKYGLPAIESMEELSIGDLTLIVGSRETDPLPLDAQGEYIGALLWQNESEDPDWFSELPTDKPVIWAYPGNPRYSGPGAVWSSGIVLRACIDALAGRDYHVVLSLGHQNLPAEYGTLPNNFRLADYVPGLSMARRCDLMLHHGGYGSCQTGLVTGTPSVVVPTFSERESNARRIAELGAGEMVLPSIGDGGKRSIDTEQLKAAVARVLGDPSYKIRAHECGDAVTRSGDHLKAARLIEEHLSSVC